MTDASEVLKAAEDFAANYLAPNAGSWELNRTMPRETFEVAASYGLCGLLVPPTQGGSGINFRTLVSVMETLAASDFAAAFALVVHNNHVRAIGTTGSDSQVNRWLPAMVEGQQVGAFLLTEPKGGSDATRIETTATQDGRDWIINGDKAWVTNAAHADLLNVFAQTQPGSGARGIASFQVPADSPGVERLPAYDLLGGYAMNAAGIRFRDVRVNPDQLLVPPGEGFRAAMSGIDIARTVVAAMSCGILQASINCVMPRLVTRQAFGQPLVDQQGLAWQVADVATDLSAAQLLAMEAATLIDNGSDATLASAHAKKFATRAGMRGVTTCMQAMGADGLKQEYPFARFLAAAKIAEYIDGTTEIQNVVISRALRQQYSEVS